MKFLLAIGMIGVIGSVSLVNGHHNGTCDDEEDGFKKCLKQFFDSKRPAQNPVFNSSINRDEAERCFISNGCQKPLFEGQQIESDLEKIKQCKQQLRQKMQVAMKECLDKKAPGHSVPSDDDRWGHHDKDDQEKRPHCQRWALAKQTQDITICPVAANGEKVRTCLKETWKRPTPEESEKWTKDFCGAKKDCLKSIQQTCQEHMNITRQLKCECSREKFPPLKQEFYACIGLTAPLKEEQKENFWEMHLCNNSCSNE